MTNRKKTHAPRALTIVGVIAIPAIAWLFYWISSDSSVPQWNNAHYFKSSQSTSNAVNNEADNNTRKRLLATSLQREIAAAKAEPSEEALTPANVEHLSKSELIRRTERMRKITPYYFEKAPEVLDEMHDSQSEDRQWTAKMEHEAGGFLDQELFEETSLLGTDCRESLCKMVLSHDNAEAYESFKRHGASDGPWLKSDIQGRRKLLENGSIETTIYFSREQDTATFEKMRERLLEIVVNMEAEE